MQPADSSLAFVGNASPTLIGAVVGSVFVLILVTLILVIRRRRKSAAVGMQALGSSMHMSGEWLTSTVGHAGGQRAVLFLFSQVF